MRKNRQANKEEDEFLPGKRHGGSIDLSWLRGNYGILCLIIMAVASLPIGCGYIMSGGIVGEWLARIKEIAEDFQMSHFRLFPSSETLAAAGITENAMNSNLWFFFSGLLYSLTENIVLAYRVYMLLIQIGTLMTAMLCFRSVLGKKEESLAAVMGITLYMTNPYRIYVCYDLANLSQATAWMLLPLYIYAVHGLLTSDKKIGYMIIAALTLAGIGYAEVIFFLIGMAVTILAGILAKKLYPLIAAVAASILFLPGLYRLWEYLFMGRFSELQLPLQPIMPKGYHLGQFFASYAFRDGYPGMGLGMMISMLVLLWMKFINPEKRSDKRIRYFAWLSMAFAVLSLSCFPWDVLQRLGVWALKIISLIGTPAIFWGMATALFCVPAADAVARAGQCKDKTAAMAIPLIVMIFCVGICVYQCNMLTYTRLPMNLDW